MIKSENRRLNLFSVLRSKRSSGSLVKAPSLTSLFDVLTTIDTNVARKDRKAKLDSRRNSMVFRSKASPSSEVTLATISPAPSDMGSLDSVLPDLLPATSHKGLDISLPRPGSMVHLGRDDVLLSYTGGLMNVPEADPASRRASVARENKSLHSCSVPTSPMLAMDMQAALNYNAFADLQEPVVLKSRLPRTTNLSNALTGMLNGRAPMSSGALLEAEERELETLRHCVGDSDTGFGLKLVANAVVMSFHAGDTQRDWDELDFDAVMRSDDDSDGASWQSVSHFC